MPALQILATKPLAGKSTVAAALAQGLAASGAQVRLERIGASEAAQQDAETFAGYLFASSSGAPQPEAPAAVGNETLVVELEAGDAPLAGLPAVISVRSAPDDADKALAASLGDRLIGTIAIAVDPHAVESVARDLTNGGLRPLALLPEDRVLAAPCVAEITASLNARVLHEGENQQVVVEDVLIGPVYSDPARPHFDRFASKAVLAHFNKTDLHLSAIETNAACLVITGGKDPSPYVIDRARREPTTILLSRFDTPGTVSALGDVWFSSRFRGDAKAEVAHAALASRLDFAGLARKLS